MNPYYLNMRSEVANFLPTDTSKMRILEIGCGAGKFKSNIVEFDEYWGIEPFESVAKIQQKILIRS
jgi:cyclopropane fatty-acyl-phospholipid synthase-like methyltransferase